MILLVRRNDMGIDDLMIVNEDANYIVQLLVNGRWVTLTEEYSASAAAKVMSNATIITKLNGRFLSKRSEYMVIGRKLARY